MAEQRRVIKFLVEDREPLEALFWSVPRVGEMLIVGPDVYEVIRVYHVIVQPEDSLDLPTQEVRVYLRHQDEIPDE